MKRKLTPSLLGAIFAALAFFGGVRVALPGVPLQVSLSAGEPIRTDDAACTTDCNRKASDCLDGCEERFKNDDKARVTCKFECANKRQKCENDCD